MTQGSIRIRGARQHNLQNLDLDIRTGEMTVVTGPSGSGKSSLVFDTLYAEGQRRYVETFSAYARQFLDRMDKPAVDKVEGVPPAIAIDQTNPVRSSRSTVGTMTELNDHLKLLYARAAQLFDRDTALPVRHDTPDTIYATMVERAAAAGDPRIVVTFPVELPATTTPDEVTQWLSASGFTRVQAEREVATPTGPRKVLDVVADRFRLASAERARVLEAIETGLKRGVGRLTVYAVPADEGAAPDIWKFSTGLHCPESDIRYGDPIPSMFSFNSAVGAFDLGDPFRQRRVHPAVVHFLEALAVDGIAADLADEQDHGRGVFTGGVHADGCVGGAGAARDEADAGLARQLAVRLGHIGRAALLAADNGFHRVAPRVQGVDAGQEALAGHHENPAHAKGLQLRNQGFAAAAWRGLCGAGHAFSC